MLTPIRPAILLSLIEMGWPADVLFRIAVNEINGVPNEGAAGWKDGQAPDFERVVQLIRGAQTAGLIDVNPSTLKEGVKKVKVSFREQKHTEEELKKLASIRELLGLEHAPGGYEVVYGARSESPNVIALQTRSLLQVLIALATEVEVPPSHVKRGFTQSFMTAENAGAPRIVRIQSGLHPPGPTAVKVQYRNTSFWIDDADFESKRVFAFVELLMQLTETTENDGPALVISTG